MNYCILGKRNIDEFVYTLRLFNQPKLVANEQGMQIYEVPYGEEFFDIQKGQQTDSLANFDKNFFSELSIRQKDIHMHYLEGMHLDFQLQKYVSDLNQTMIEMCFILEAQEIYKALKPLLSQGIKQLQIQICHIIIDSHLSKVSFQMNINVVMEIGVMTLTQPIKQIDGTWIQIPLLETKLMTFDTDQQSQIKRIIGCYDFGLKCGKDEIILTPFQDFTQQVCFQSSQMKQYNDILITENIGNLYIKQITNRTYYPIMIYACKIKNDLYLYIDLDKKMDRMNLIFVSQVPGLSVYQRQSTYFECNYQIIKKNQLEDCVVDEYIKELQPENEENETNEIPQIKQIQTQQDLPFVPAKVTNSINQTILELLKKAQQKE
ncbi:hypothetical protein pb186bvf_015411 [Paramecium bursaria]